MSVPRDPGDVMYVTAERMADALRLPFPTHPDPRPRPTPTPTPVPVARRTGPQRLSPGPVAADARNVVRRCGMGSSQTE